MWAGNDSDKGVKKMAAKAVVGETGASFELVSAEDCGAEFVALVKTVPRTNGDKVKRLVFNKKDLAAVRKALA